MTERSKKLTHDHLPPTHPPPTTPAPTTSSRNRRRTGNSTEKDRGDSDDQHEAMIQELMKHANEDVGMNIDADDVEKGGGGSDDDSCYDELNEDEDFDDDIVFMQNQQDELKGRPQRYSGDAGEDGQVIPSELDNTNSVAGSRKRRLLKKAPTAPKRFKSAYICFVTEKMESVKQGLPPDTKVTEIMKTLAYMWKTLPPLERMTYEKIAEEDKTRYFDELAHYSGPMQVPNKRQKKPPGAPKRAMSAFLSFSQIMRPKLRDENPGLKNTDISTLLAQRWHNAAEEEKRPHIERELRDREKYHDNMAKWKEEVQAQGKPSATAASSMLESLAIRSASSSTTSSGAPIPMDGEDAESGSTIPLTTPAKKRAALPVSSTAAASGKSTTATPRTGRGKSKGNGNTPGSGEKDKEKKEKQTPSIEKMIKTESEDSVEITPEQIDRMRRFEQAKIMEHHRQMLEHPQYRMMPQQGPSPPPDMHPQYYHAYYPQHMMYPPPVAAAAAPRTNGDGQGAPFQVYHFQQQHQNGHPHHIPPVIHYSYPYGGGYLPPYAPHMQQQSPEFAINGGTNKVSNDSVMRDSQQHHHQIHSVNNVNTSNIDRSNNKLAVVSNISSSENEDGERKHRDSEMDRNDSMVDIAEATKNVYPFHHPSQQQFSVSQSSQSLTGGGSTSDLVDASSSTISFPPSSSSSTATSSVVVPIAVPLMPPPPATMKSFSSVKEKSASLLTSRDSTAHFYQQLLQSGSSPSQSQPVQSSSSQSGHKQGSEIQQQQEVSVSSSNRNNNNLSNIIQQQLNHHPFYVNNNNLEVSSNKKNSSLNGSKGSSSQNKKSNSKKSSTNTGSSNGISNNNNRTISSKVDVLPTSSTNNSSFVDFLDVPGTASEAVDYQLPQWEDNFDALVTFPYLLMGNCTPPPHSLYNTNFFESDGHIDADVEDNNIRGIDEDTSGYSGNKVEDKEMEVTESDEMKAVGNTATKVKRLSTKGRSSKSKSKSTDSIMSISNASPPLVVLENQQQSPSQQQTQPPLRPITGRVSALTANLGLSSLADKLHQQAYQPPSNIPFEEMSAISKAVSESKGKSIISGFRGNPYATLSVSTDGTPSTFVHPATLMSPVNSNSTPVTDNNVNSLTTQRAKGQARSNSRKGFKSTTHAANHIVSSNIQGEEEMEITNQ